MGVFFRIAITFDCPPVHVISEKKKEFYIKLNYLTNDFMSIGCVVAIKNRRIVVRLSAK